MMVGALVKAALGACLASTMASQAWAAPQETTFIISPGGGQTRYIEVHLVEACRFRGVNPWGPSCARGQWSFVSNNQTINRKGKFCVHARWGAREFIGQFEMPPRGAPIRLEVRPQPPNERGKCE